MPNIEALEMLNVVRGCLRDIEYREDLLLPDYKYRDTRESASSVVEVSRQIDLAAFAQSPPNLRSACIGVTVTSDASPERIAVFRSLGAPQILVLDPDTQLISRWKMFASGLPERQERRPFAEVERLFDERRVDWSPDTILRAKEIAFAPAERQLDFMDVGLLPALEAELRSRLNDDLKSVLAVCKKTFRQRYSEEVFEAASEGLYRLLFRLIAAKYSIDRDKKPEWERLNAPDVVSAVEAYFSGHTHLEPALDDAPTQNAAWQAIRDGLNLSNLSPEILAYLYENTLVTSTLRKKYGIHATPPVIAEYMVSQLPIADLDRNERRVFEPFCGAAPFLIAALGQLRTLDTEVITPEARHDYFQQMLVGMEISAFSREIAFCALVLADDANRDSWQIFGGNAFTSPEFQKHLGNANIVLCNPPHETFAKAEQLKPDGAVYDNQAAEALHRVVQRKPPIFGFVLPRAFVDGTAFRALREEVVNVYSDVSVVTLPDKAFEKADQEVALLMAHNLRENGHRYYSANVSEDEWETFLQTRTPFDEYEVTTLQRRENNTPILWYPPLQHLWKYLDSYPTLETYADIYRGIQYNPPVEASIYDTPQSHTRAGIASQDGYLEAFFIPKHQYLSVRKEDVFGTKHELPWERPKVLVNRSRSSRGYWRIAGVADYEQRVASAQFHGVWAREDAPVELLAALISGPIINAYLFTHDGLRDNYIKTLASAPVPRFTSEQVKLIVSLVQDYASYRLRWLKKEGEETHLRERCLQRLWQIDAAVLEAYALPDNLERELLQRFEGAKRTPLPFDFPGYGKGYALAKETLEAEKAFQGAVQRYQELCGQKYNRHITPAEFEEMQRLAQVIDAHEAVSNPLYGLFGIAEGGPADGAENHDAYLYRL